MHAPPSPVGYSYASWKEDAKRVLSLAGVEGKGVTLVFKDNEHFPEQVLDDVVHLLVSGELHDLYTPDELEEIRTAIALDFMSSAGRSQQVESSRLSSQDYMA